MLIDCPEERLVTLTCLPRLPLSADLARAAGQGGAAGSLPWGRHPGHSHSAQWHSLPQSWAHQGTSTAPAEPVPLLLCWHWAWNTTKSKEKKGKEKGEWEGGGRASSALLLIHFSAFNHSKAVTSSAPGSLYMHKRKAIPFRRIPWVIDLMLNVMFGSAALSAPSHGKLMFPTNPVEWYSVFLKMKCWGLGVKGRHISAFILGLQDTFWVMMKGKPARN